MSTRITIYQDADLNDRQDLEISDGGGLYIIEMSNYWGKWKQVEKTLLPMEVLTKGIQLISHDIIKDAEKKWNKALFRLVKKLKDGTVTLEEFEKEIKYEPERHKYPKGQPRLKGGN